MSSEKAASVVKPSDELRRRIDEASPWFYEFDLGPYGRTRSYLPQDVLPIHATRLEMMEGVVKAHFGSRLPEIEAIDVGCHEGYYAVALARRGLRRVVGLDVRRASLVRARLASEALDLKNLFWTEGDCEGLPKDLGEFPLSLFLGVLYHVENPMRCLRNIARLTTELCVLETQVIGEVEGTAEWGSRDWTRPYRGALALIDEAGELGAGNAEAGVSPVAMCPSPEALRFMLKAAGFRRVEFVPPPPGAYEQHARGKRVVCAAYK